MPYTATVPMSGVSVGPNPLLNAVMQANIDYLLTSFDTDHLLYHFRVRAGKCTPCTCKECTCPSPWGSCAQCRCSHCDEGGTNPCPLGKHPQVAFWDTDLKGSNAGRFLMGAGNSLRWVTNSKLRAMMNAVVDGIAECRNQSNGYIYAFEPAAMMHSEQGDYGRAWFT